MKGNLTPAIMKARISIMGFPTSTAPRNGLAMIRFAKDVFLFARNRPLYWIVPMSSVLLLFAATLAIVHWGR